jgi:hypothetical protein
LSPQSVLLEDLQATDLGTTVLKVFIILTY